MLWEAFRLALRAIRRNMLRSFLTVLGVVIGVAAVIAMVTVGQGSSAKVSADVASLGTNVLVLRPGKAQMGPPSGGRDTSPLFTLRDAEALRSLSVVAAASPSSSSSVTVVSGNTNTTTTVTGIDADFFDVRAWPLVLGVVFILSVILFPRGLFGEVISWIDAARGRGPGGKRTEGTVA